MIEKTYFTTYDRGAIVNWLSANATEYFDEFDTSEDNKINCISKGRKIFTIFRNPEKNNLLQFIFYGKNGEYTTAASTAWADNSAGVSKSSNYIRRLTKTSKGIAIAMHAHCYAYNGSSGSTQKEWTVDATDALFITKDNNGETTFVFDVNLNTGYPYYTEMYIANGKTTTDVIYVMNYNLDIRKTITPHDISHNYGVINADYIQLVPIPVPNQGLCYLPGCCITYAGNLMNSDTADVSIHYNNEKYIYNGYIALKE